MVETKKKKKDDVLRIELGIHPRVVYLRRWGSNALEGKFERRDDIIPDVKRFFRRDEGTHPSGLQKHVFHSHGRFPERGGYIHDQERPFQPMVEQVLQHLDQIPSGEEQPSGFLELVHELHRPPQENGAAFGQEDRFVGKSGFGRHRKLHGPLSILRNGIRSFARKHQDQHPHVQSLAHGTSASALRRVSFSLCKGRAHLRMNLLKTKKK